MFDWLRNALRIPSSPEPEKKEKIRSSTSGLVTITCRSCGKTITLPESVQHWPDLCQECRAKTGPQGITRTCKGCGESFTFSSDISPWPTHCPKCQAKKNRRG